MFARIRKSMEQKDQGFTLIELLVVMIIIGILAAIAIPVFLNQRKKAVDTAAKSDVSTLGKEVATYYVDATTVLPATGVAIVSNRYQVNSVDVGAVSSGISSVKFTIGAATTVADAIGKWCVELDYAGGTQGTVSYSAANGMVVGGTCV